MTRVILLLLMALTLATPALAASNASHAVTVPLTVRGMMCGSCAAAVKKALAPIPGISEVNVDLPKDLVTVTYDDRKATVPQMLEAIRKAGYRAEAPPAN